MARSVTAPPGFRHLHRIMTEPDEFSDAASGIQLTVDFQKRQERASSVEHFQSPDWALDFGEANVRTRVRGVLNGGWGSLCLARGPGEANWNGQAAAPGTLSLMAPGEELDGRTSSDFGWLTAAVPPAVWERCVSLAGAKDQGPRGLTVCQPPPALLARLETRLREIQRGLLEEASAMSPNGHGKSFVSAAEETANFVAEAFTTACELAAGTQAPKDSLRNRARLTRRAQAWLQEHMGDAVQVPDLCEALHVSRRELEYAFRSVLDQSPRDYLEALRLNAIRRALLRADATDATVISIAYAHGVNHLSRFAANYRKLFGEKPGETLKGR